MAESRVSTSLGCGRRQARKAPPSPIQRTGRAEAAWCFRQAYLALPGLLCLDLMPDRQYALPQIALARATHNKRFPWEALSTMLRRSTSLSQPTQPFEFISFILFGKDLSEWRKGGRTPVIGQAELLSVLVAKSMRQDRVRERRARHFGVLWVSAVRANQRLEFEVLGMMRMWS